MSLYPVVDDRTFSRLLDRVRKPARYIGGERERVSKDPADVDVRVCLAFPDAYEIGMSHLGLRILYAHLNARPRIFAERAYCPFPDMEAELRRAELPLFSVETRTALTDFHVVGFSLQSEMTHSNLLTMLDLGRIPLHRTARRAGDPIVIAGGPVAFNPEPLSDFIDAFLVGDGEEEFAHFLERDFELRSQNVPRAERLARLAQEITGLYVPALYATETDAETGFVHVAAKGDAPYPVRKALLDDVNAYPYPSDILTPQADIVHDRVAVEIARGCTEGCRFCQAGIIYRPVRERSPQAIFDAVVGGVERTGYDEASLTALSTADYSCITPLARTVMTSLAKRRTAMSVSSLRVYGVTEELARTIASVRKTGFTIAPEAGTQRLRDVINKGVSDEDIVAAANIAFANGWTRLKLYFMIGLPTETDDDVLGIAGIAIKVWTIGRELGVRGIKIVVSVSSLVPKPHSTFQWVPFDNPDNLRRKQQLLAAHLRKFRGIELRTHDVAVSRLEAAFSRGDRRLGRVIERAWRNGARFDEWADWFKEQIWRDAFVAEGMDVDDFLGALPTEADLIWDHIDARVTKDFLLKDLKRGLASRFSHPCEKPYLPRRHGPLETKEESPKLVCYDCGVDCDLSAIAKERVAAGKEVDRLFMAAMAQPAGNDVSAKRGAPAVAVSGSPPARQIAPFAPTSGPTWRYRVCYAKQGLSRYLSHLEVVRVMARAGRRARWPVAFSGGFHPHPKLAFAPALPVGVAGENEYFDVILHDNWTTARLISELNAQLHEGFTIRGAIQLAERAAAIETAIDRFDYAVTFSAAALGAALGSAAGLRNCLAQKLSTGSWVIERTVKQRLRRIDAREFVASSQITSANGSIHWALTLSFRERRSVKPRELIESLCRGWPDGTDIVRNRMGRLIDGQFVTPMEAVTA